MNGSGNAKPAVAVFCARHPVAQKPGAITLVLVQSLLAIRSWMMAFVKLTRPDNSPVLINTDIVLSCAPVPTSGPVMGPSATGTRIVFTSGTHQDVLELVDQVLAVLNAAHGQH